MEDTEIYMEKKNPSLLALALESAGIAINGKADWDIQVHNKQLYAQVLNAGSLGFGEAYMDKWWDCERLDIFFEKVLRAKLNEQIKLPVSYKMKWLLSKVINLQSKTRSKQVAVQHYDLGNDLFIAMLDKNMVY